MLVPIAWDKPAGGVQATNEYAGDTCTSRRVPQEALLRSGPARTPLPPPAESSAASVAAAAFTAEAATSRSTVIVEGGIVSFDFAPAGVTVAYATSAIIFCGDVNLL